MRLHTAVPLLAIVLSTVTGCGGRDRGTTGPGPTADGGASGSSDAGGLCTNTCEYANDGECDDGSPGAAYSLCELGTDCNDCGATPGGDAGMTEVPVTACVTTLELYVDTAHTVLHSTEHYCDEFGGECASGSGAYTEYTEERFVGETCASRGYSVQCSGSGLWYRPGEVPDACSGSSGCDYAECIAAGNTPMYCERCL
jgi:hypothetical protein